MKTKRILWVIIAMFIVGTIFIAGTFRMEAQTSTVVEKKIGNTVYKLEKSNNSCALTNKANKITGPEIHNYFGLFSLDNSELANKAWRVHFKPVFSKERAKELNFNINLRCICDSTGLIKEVDIYIYKRENFEKLTLSEIKAIEDAAKKYRIPFTEWHGGKEDKYVSVSYPLNPYLIYFEKTE